MRLREDLVREPSRTIALRPGRWRERGQGRLLQRTRAAKTEVVNDEPLLRSSSGRGLQAQSTSQLPMQLDHGATEHSM